jgi:hypothetical protein
MASLPAFLAKPRYPAACELLATLLHRGGRGEEIALRKLQGCSWARRMDFRMWENRMHHNARREDQLT